jgi:glycosyltransferase involved in cell wall biosynthesis
MPSIHGATVSLCMIVRNEEHNLRDCLSPVAGLFDEIVVVDTGSTDGTREIAREFTEHVYDFPWEDDFAAARNEMLHRSSGDWIFWLDADDRVAPEEVEKLRCLLSELDYSRSIHMITTVCRFEHDADGVQLLSHARLFRKSPDLSWKGRVHEQLHPPPNEAGYVTFSTNIQVEHLGYSVGAVKLKKMQRDIRLLRMDFAADPEDVSTLYHLALAYARFANYAEARKYLMILEKQSPTDPVWAPRLYELLCKFHEQTGDLRQALACAEKGLQSFPENVALLYQVANKLYQLGDAERCLGTINKIELLPDVPTQWHGGSLGEIRERWVPLLAIDALSALDRMEEAGERLERLARERPGDSRVFYSLGVHQIKTSQRDRLPDIRIRLEPLPNGDIFAQLLLVDERMFFGEIDGVGEEIDRLIAMAPLLPRARLLRLDYLARTGARVVDYLAACRDALRCCPNEPNVLAQVAQIEAFLKMNHASQGNP